MTSRHRSTRAAELKQLLIASSPLIEELTAAVCPDCIDVCCRQRHGTHGESDVQYLQLLAVAVPGKGKQLPPDGPCEFIGPQGCSLPRWHRPHKCTFFFCEQLVAAMHADSPRKARRLIDQLQRMAELARSLHID